MFHMTATGRLSFRLAAALVAAAVLAGCEEGQGLAFLQPQDKAEAEASGTSSSTKLVERDVEAPDAFHAAEAGLWDGRPSLGGVWVAHPDAKDPERVIIRNTANGKFVIGALFRREREIPGPRIQASSDAATALGMLAGAPVQLDVTALRREAVEEDPPADETTELAEAIPADDIEESALDPIAGAAAAIDAPAPAAEAAAAASTAAVAATPEPQPKPKPKKSSSLSKPYIQIGIFSVEANAERTADQMRSAGMVPTVLAQSSNGKAFWRVLVGPAQSKSELSALLKQVKATGFSDAYAVTN